MFSAHYVFISWNYQTLLIAFLNVRLLLGKIIEVLRHFGKVTENLWYDSRKSSCR